MDRSYIFLMIFIALTLSVEAAPDVDALVQESRSGLTPEQAREYRAMAADIGEDRGSGSESHETADTAPVMDEAKKVASTSEDTDAAPADNHRVLTEAQRKEFEDLNKQDGFPGEKSSQAEPVKATPDQEEFKATQAEVGVRRESGSEPHETADTAPVMDEAKKVTSTSEDTDAAPADNHHFLTDAQNKAINDLNKQSESSEAVETTPEQDDTVTPVAKEDTAEPQPVAEPKVTQMTEDKHGETSWPAEAVETTPEQDDTVTPVAKEDAAEPQPVAEPKVTQMTEDKHGETSWPAQADEVTPIAKEDTAEPQPVAEPKVTQMTEDKHGKTSSPVQADEVTPVAKEDAAEPQPVAEPKVTQMTEDKHVESASWDVKSQDDDVADSVDEVEKEEMKELSGDPKDVIKRLAEQFEARKMMTSK